MELAQKQFLEKYLNNPSPTGFESGGQQIWLDYIRPHVDDYLVDTYGTVVGIINPDAPYKVVLEAHADEISWFVNYITDKGYIYLKRNGGSDPIIAPSKRVNIFTPSGVVKGIFGWPAIHVRHYKEKEETPSMKNIFLDVGASSRDEVEAMGIHVGCVATFEDEVMYLNGKYLVGRALDNRIGGYMIAEVARRLKANQIQLPFCLYIVNSVQEEIGLRGAEMISRRLKPDCAIITDVCHDTQSPMYEKEVSGDIACGKGPTLTYGPAVHNKLLNHIIQAAQETGIPFQRVSADRATGTDTDAFAYSSDGVASALISLPLKYMHTTVETISIEDMEHVIDLMYESVVRLDGKEDWKYIR